MKFWSQITINNELIRWLSLAMGGKGEIQMKNTFQKKI